MKKKLHSEEYFGEQRDFWWNSDFLELMAKRWRLDQCRFMLDAGCGIGHWGRVLSPHLHQQCRVVGVDLEEAWIEQSKAHAASRGLQERFHYQKGDVTSLDFPDNTFDIVTCQTVLIHVADPIKVIKEFKRVLKPNGLLAVVEPNNVAATMVRSSICFLENIDDILETTRFQMICERGKAALGKGHNSIGDLVPGYFGELGFSEIQTFISDKASPLIPPYDSQEQQANLKQMDDWENREIWTDDKAESYRYFVEGGGRSEDFQSLWQKIVCNEKAKSKRRQARLNGTYHTAGGGMVYLVSGRKV